MGAFLSLIQGTTNGRKSRIKISKLAKCVLSFALCSLPLKELQFVFSMGFFLRSLTGKQVSLQSVLAVIKMLRCSVSLSACWMNYMIHELLSTCISFSVLLTLVPGFAHIA